MRSFLPIYKCGIDELEDGSIIKLCGFCKKNNRVNNDKCKNFYKDIFNKQGMFICPYGLNSYVEKSEGSIDIFTGFRVRGKFDSKKANPKILKNDDNRVISEEEMLEYIISYRKVFDYKLKKEFMEEFLENCIHDVRKFNATIKDKSEYIMNKGNGNGKKDKERVRSYSKSIWAMSQFISTRLSEYDYLYADSPLRCGEKYEFNFYKCFDKIRICLEDEAKKQQKRILVSCHGTCSFIEAYDSIKYMPYLLIDNALKYSLKNSEINVTINDSDDKQCIEIKSMGAFVEENEIKSLFKRGYRGANARKFNEQGSGIGLYLANKICEANGITINVLTEKIFEFDRVQRCIDKGIFKVLLCLEKNR